MAHQAQMDFCNKIRRLYPDFFVNKFVLDIGSLDINGCNRNLFENCTYIGIDIADGNNVDLFVKGHELQLPDESIDVIISTECFEHDMHYKKTISNIYRMLKKGGLFIFTCATEGRAEHGTRKTCPFAAPLLQDLDEWCDYYKNLTEHDIRMILNIEHDFKMFLFETNMESYDLYFYGFKTGDFAERTFFHRRDNSTHTLIEKMNEKILELEASKTALQALLNDNSWRYTKFITKMIGKFKSLFSSILKNSD